MRKIMGTDNEKILQIIQKYYNYVTNKKYVAVKKSKNFSQ